MKLSNIHSKYVIQELFSFISIKQMFKLVKNNSFLIKKLDLSTKDIKNYFFQKKMENYDYIYINEYYEKFKKDFNSIIQNENELKELFDNSLSKNKNFELNLFDTDFNSIFNNSYFRQKIKINLDDLNQERILKILIEDNKLSDIAIKIIKNIFNIFSIDGKMNKTQYALYLSYILKKEVNENDSIVENIFFEYNRNRNGLLTFNEFCKFNLDLIQNRIYYIKDYNSNLLEYILNNIEEFDINSNNIFSNLYKISKQKIYKLSLFINIDKIFIEFLNKYLLFQNIKKINISISNLNKIIELKIICSNIEEVNLYVYDDDLKYNYSVINDIFPNMKKFTIYIERKFNIFNLMMILINSKIETLKIFIYDNDINYKIDSQIILSNIRNLEIDIEKGYNLNDFLFNFFNHIQFPSLEQYILNLDLNQFNNQKLNSNNNDYNIINQFLIHILNNQNQFYLKSFFNLINQIQFINNLQLNLKKF